MINGRSFVGVTGQAYAEGKPQAVEPPDVRLALMYGWVVPPIAEEQDTDNSWNPDAHPSALTLMLADFERRLRKLENRASSATSTSVASSVFITPSALVRKR